LFIWILCGVIDNFQIRLLYSLAFQCIWIWFLKSLLEESYCLTFSYILCFYVAICVCLLGWISVTILHGAFLNE
jgi:hypothetical protein